MPRPTTPVTVRGECCPKCGADEWRRRVEPKRETWRCQVCARKSMRASQKRLRRDDPARTMWYAAKARAGRKGVVFTITLDDVRAAWPADGRCPALGILLIQCSGTGAAADHSPTLDRIDPARGYEPGNIAVICHLANRAKNTCTARDLERLAAWMRRQGLD